MRCSEPQHQVWLKWEAHPNHFSFIIRLILPLFTSDSHITDLPIIGSENGGLNTYLTSVSELEGNADPVIHAHNLSNTT